MKLGIVGQPSSGKDTVALYLQDHHHFIHFSCGDFFRKYIAEHSLGEPLRPLLQKVANELRQKYGGDYVIREALKIKFPFLVISGIRNVAEAKALKEAGGRLISIEVPLEKRYERVKARNRPGDNLTFEEFRIQQEAEEESADPMAQNMNAVIRMADYIITNDGTLDDLHQKIDELLLKISSEKKG